MSHSFPLFFRLWTLRMETNKYDIDKFHKTDTVYIEFAKAATEVSIVEALNGIEKKIGNFKVESEEQTKNYFDPIAGEEEEDESRNTFILSGTDILCELPSYAA